MSEVRLDQIIKHYESTQFSEVLSLLQAFSPNNIEEKNRSFLLFLESYTNLRQFNDVINHYQCFLPMELKNTPPIFLKATILFTRSLLRTGNVNKSLEVITTVDEYFNESKNLLGNENFNSIEYELNLRKGEIYYTLGKYKDAESCFNTCKTKIDTSKDVSKSLILNNAIGLNYFAMGEYERGFQLFKQNIEITLQIQDIKGTLVSYHNIGAHYLAVGDVFNSIKYLKLGLELLKEIPDKYFEQALNFTIGTSYGSIGEIEISESYLKKSLSLAENLNNLKLLCESLNNLGEIYGLKGDLVKAKEYYERSLKIGLNENLLSNSLTALNSLTHISILQNQKSDISKYHNQLNILKTNIQSGMGSSIVKLTDSYVKRYDGTMRDLIIAQELLQEIIEDKQTDFLTFKAAIFELIEIHILEYKISYSQSILDKVENHIQNLLKKAEEQHAFSIIIEVFTLQSRLELIKGNFQNSEKLMKNALNLAREKKYFYYQNSAYRYYDELLPFLHHRNVLLHSRKISPLDESLIEFEKLLQTVKNYSYIDLDIPEEHPIALIIYNREYNIIYLSVFDELEFELMEEELFPLAHTTIKRTIGDEVEQLGKIEPFYFNNHQCLFKPLQGYIIGYVMQGRSFTAQYKLDNFADILSLSRSMFNGLISEKLGNEEKSQLDQVVKQIFIHSEDESIDIHGKTSANKDRFDNIQGISEELSKIMVHPHRLNIVKILCDNIYLTRNSLQKALNIKSGTLERHLNILEKNGLIESSFELVNDRPSKVLQITVDGRNYYQSIIDQLSL